MTSQQSTKLVLATLCILTLAVLCISVWKMLGTLGTAPAPSESSHIPSPAAPQEAAAQPARPAQPQRPYPARVGHSIDVSNHPDFAGLAATKVSLDLTNAPLADALDALGQATSLNGLGDYLRQGSALEVPPLTMQLKDAPLMEAILEFCSRAGASISDFSPGQIKLQSASLDGWVGRWCVAGPFAMSLIRMQASSQLDPKAGTRFVAALNANFFAEPDLRIASFSRTPTIEEAADENGQSIGALSSISLARAPSSASIFEFMAHWNLAPGHGQKIARLRGTVQFTLASKVDTFTHDLGGADPFIQTIHGVTFELSPLASPGGQRYTVKLHLTRGDADAAYWQRLMATLDDPGPRMLVDDRQQRPAGAGNSNPNPNERIMTFMVSVQQNAPPPQQFLLEIPTDTRSVRVPFEFTDVTLP